MDFTNEAYHVCSLCECGPSMHCYFWSCPLFSSEKICVECCLDDITSEEAEQKLKEITGLNRSRKEIDAICKACGKRSAEETT